MRNDSHLDAKIIISRSIQHQFDKFGKFELIVI